MTQLDLSAKIIGDINLCGGATPPVQGTPSTSQLGTHPYGECMIKYKFVTETIGKNFLFVYFYVSHVNGTVALGEVP